MKADNLFHNVFPVQSRSWLSQNVCNVFFTLISLINEGWRLLFFSDFAPLLAQLSPISTSLIFFKIHPFLWILFIDFTTLKPYPHLFPPPRLLILQLLYPLIVCSFSATRVVKRVCRNLMTRQHYNEIQSAILPP